MPKEIGHYVTRPGRRLGDAEVTIPVPKDLETAPGIPSRDEDISFYTREYPLESLAVEESAALDYMLDSQKQGSPEAVKHYKAHHEAMEPINQYIRETGKLDPTAEPTGEDVTEAIRRKAKELGYGEVGFTRFDHRYLYLSQKRVLRYDLPHVICLAHEQDYEKTQTTPSVQSEEAHNGSYERMGALTKELVEFILAQGYHAQATGASVNYSPSIPMFVNAGLGQLGANGQLLSPLFGSWARLQMIHTDAKVTYDEPVDYGIHAFCQVCQVCVKRCPGRALMREKVWYRGVEKNPVSFDRCHPIVSKYLSCGVCMKVCPVGAYGMKAVMDHYIQTGEVLGKGTHNLEGYSLPGKDYYGPDEMPRITEEEFYMPRGKSEDWILIEFRNKLMATKDDPTVDKDAMWDEFQGKVESAI